MRFDDALRLLESGRTAGLPGPDAQAAMAPRPRRFWVPGVIPAGARRAAGLALLYPDDREATLILTVRGAHLATHRGQVSLPGGAVEAGESVEQAALREAEEEVALPPRDVTVRLALTPLHIPVSGYVLHPLVATVEAPPALHPEASEVDRIFAVPVAALVAGEGLAIETREREGLVFEVPYFDLGGAKLWGATAMIVAELLAVLGHRVDPWSRK